MRLDSTNPLIVLAWADLINKRDFFDQTPLHFAAAIQRPNLDVIMRLIQFGADVESTNSRGQTFLHVLFLHKRLDELSEHLDLLRYLAEHRFPFSRRDYHGCTPLHVLLRPEYHVDENTVQVLEEIMNITKPDVDALDSFGISIRHYIEEKTQPQFGLSRIQCLFFGYQTSPNHELKFSSMFSKMSRGRKKWVDLRKWVDWIGLNDRSTWIDVDGETALTALLKYWRHEDDELVLSGIVKDLVGIGMEIRLRNREGNTALAIAAIRGFRPVVTALLEFGASIQCRNYRGESILEQVGKELREAKHGGRDRLYATVLSCSNLLVDLGATTNLDPEDQWLSEASRKSNINIGIS